MLDLDKAMIPNDCESMAIMEIIQTIIRTNRAVAAANGSANQFGSQSET